MNTTPKERAIYIREAQKCREFLWHICNFHWIARQLLCRVFEISRNISQSRCSSRQPAFRLQLKRLATRRTHDCASL